MVLTRASCICIALALASCGGASARAPAAPAIPAVTLTDTAGATTSLPADLARSPFTVIVFYADHCPCFRVHDQRIAAMAAAYAPRGVRFLLVDSEVSASAAADTRAAAERGLPPIAVDRDATLADALGAEYATFAVVLDARGRVRYRGGVDSDKTSLHDDATLFVRDALDDLLAGREPRIAEGKTLGCALQRH